MSKPSLGLRPLPTEIWEGFVFVHPGDQPDQSLTDYLGEQGADPVGYPFDLCEQRFAFAAEIGANWKCMVDSFCESYHLPVIHRRGIGKTMAGPVNPACRLVDVRLKGPHRTISLWANMHYQPTPVQGLAYENAPGPAITSGRAEAEFRFPKGLNQTRSDCWSLDVTIVKLQTGLRNIAVSTAKAESRCRPRRGAASNHLKLCCPPYTRTAMNSAGTRGNFRTGPGQ